MRGPCVSAKSNRLHKITPMEKNEQPIRKTFQNSILAWIDERLPVISIMQREYINYPTPRNVNYFWSFGAIATVMLLVMITTGLVLAMQYTSHTAMAFSSVQRIMRDVNYGWLLRTIHMNGASMFFLAVYIHIYRGMYYGSYKKPRELIWILGVMVFLLMMATAFTGYVLPWGQMSYWAATVITNLFSAVPLIGEHIVSFLWGGFSVDNPTLNRFFVLHFLLPFVILGVVLLHVAALHVTGSNNPDGVDVKSKRDTLPFHPYITSKDSLAMLVFAIIYAAIVFYAPNFLNHPDNAIPANPLSTPEHIVPEWYFLPFYAVLRAIPNKLLGVLGLFGGVAILFFLPFLDRSKVRSCRYRPIYRWFLWAFVIDVVFLGWLGGRPAEEPYILWARLGTLYYFGFFLLLVPLVSLVERPSPLPASISEPVLKTADRPRVS